MLDARDLSTLFNVFKINSISDFHAIVYHV